MAEFDDFDAWAAVIRGASLRLACHGVETRRWTIEQAVLGDVTLQVANEGGGNLCYGGNTHPGPIVFLPLTHAGEHVVNCEHLCEGSLLVIPPGADFRILVKKRAHSWCSIALPAEDVAWVSGPASGTVARDLEAVPYLRRLVEKAAAWLFERPGDTAAHVAAGREIRSAALACLPKHQASRVAIGRPRLDRAAIIRRAMAMIDAAPTVPTASKLADDIGVTGRTLLRTFRETYGVPPKRYLILRELHVIRRSLQETASGEATVADVLTRHGVWDFGRFAARYRRQFGESPSETIRRVRG
jgi:AraC family ethanolamine operon transcriptional activator